MSHRSRPDQRPIPDLLTAGLVAAGSAALLLGQGWPPLLRIPFAIIVFLWAPGYALLRLLLPRVPDGEPLRGWAGPLALSPVIATALYIVCRMTGVGVGPAPWVVTGVTLLLILVPIRSTPAIPPANDMDMARSSGPERREILVLALAVGLLVLLLFLVNPWLRWRADGRFHIGVTAEILRGTIPPTDPFFAGLDLQYMWFFHATLALLRSASGASASALLVVANVTALVGFAGLTWQFVRALSGSARSARWAVLVVLFGMGSLGWLFLPVKLMGAFVGADRGWSAVRPIFDLWPPTIPQVSAFFELWKDQVFFLRKFLVGTAMSFTLGALALHAEAARRATFGGGVGDFVLAALAAAGVVVLHPMMGIPEVAVVVVLAGVLWLWPRFRPLQGGLTGRRFLAFVIAHAVGVALALPYLRLVTAGKEGEAGFPVAFLPSKIVSLVALSLGVGIAAVPWLWRTLRERRPDMARLWLAGYALLMIGFAMIVRFPLEAENIDKPTLLTHWPLALIAGVACGAAWDAAHGLRRRPVRIYLWLLLVPANVLLLAAYALEPDPRTYRAHEREAQRFVDANAPWDAVVFDSQDRDRPGVEIQRRMYWSHEQYATTHEYPKAEMDARRSVRDALYATGGPDSAGVARLQEFGAPAWIMVRAGAAVPGGGFPPGRGSVEGSFGRGDTDPLALRGAFERMFDSDDVRVYRLRDQR